MNVTQGTAVWPTDAVEAVIPQAVLSHPDTREAVEPVLCRVCKERVPMCDREVSGAVHPACAEGAVVTGS